LFYASSAARRRADARGLAITAASALMAQLLAGTMNLLLAAPVWLQMVHLLLADTLWIALVLLGAQLLAAPPVVPSRR
jgi:heme A synthase